MERMQSLYKIKDFFLIVLIILDIIFLVYITFYTVNPSVENSIIQFDLFLCIILFIEFSYNLRKADDKVSFLKDNWTDIIAFIPIDFLRAFRFIRIFKALKILSLFKKDLKNVFNFLGRTHLDKALGILLFAIIAGTIIFYIIEGNVNQGVHNLSDAFWFSLTTTLVGGGEITAQTLYGRTITGLLMIVGITFVGFLTASIASWAVKNPEEEENLKKRIKTMETSLKNLETNLDEIREILKQKKD